ncbi:putative gdsl-like lipase acylhydrolase protein [Daldinia childiae]|uniref:putative gdsl-like lipase acylhydrolase protein n=1 Tax=Daldinia childiae TaxID=326645 RepID=UPI0014471BC6|nr:putative gdsl-like lipase acylhydrolase protein [Daldinia childiae]KAF3060041.1 putative gdsl-like lipase acylhydrolase protein [Daldinia childiae]
MPRRTLRILCFGNSLTSGFPVGKPYAEKLTEKLEEALLGHGYGEIQYEVEGVPGDLVTRGSFLDRMRDSWKKRSEFYDWTIVLGGTNDLGWGCAVDDIVAGLKRTWDIPLLKGSKVLALTIPDTRARYKDVKERRDEVNNAIKEYRKPNFFYFDLHNAIPYHNMEPSDRPKYWQMDGVHLTEDGYNLMGEKIATELIKLIRLAEAQDTDISSIAKDARQRQAIEDMIYEEERGNPRLLSQGYIVVRKTDLD